MQKQRAINIHVRDLKEETGMAASSFYIHYKSLDDLIEVNENRVLAEVRAMLSEVDQETISVECFYRHILFIIYRYRDFFAICFYSNSATLLALVVDEFESFVMKDWNDYGVEVNACIFGQFQASLIKEIDFWSMENFDIDKLNKHANTIAKINRSMPIIFAALYKCSK